MKTETIKKFINTCEGEADFVTTEIEDAEGNWNNNYPGNDGYWIIHDGQYHYIYKVRT